MGSLGSSDLYLLWLFFCFSLSQVTTGSGPLRVWSQLSLQLNLGSEHWLIPEICSSFTAELPALKHCQIYFSLFSCPTIRFLIHVVLSMALSALLPGVSWSGCFQLHYLTPYRWKLWVFGDTGVGKVVGRQENGFSFSAPPVVTGNWKPDVFGQYLCSGLSLL